VIYLKIEKISENQIKCTLTQQDLKDHNIRISELAYGSEKAKALFREMMTQAFEEVGFNADNIPLMVEAIPEKQNSLVLIITKVDNPDEIDTRFSKLSPSSVQPSVDNGVHVEGADDIIDVFRRLHDSKKNAGTAKGKDASQAGAVETKRTAASAKTASGKNSFNLVRLYRFSSLDHVIQAASALGKFYNGDNSLYRSKKSGSYFLVVHQSSCTPEEFNKVCNILSEYGFVQTYQHAAEAHLAEHEETVLAHNAIQQLAHF
jgi:adapter protein MecA 1/2